MTFINPALKELLKNAEQRDSYWVESAKLAFAVELHKRCRAAGITNAQLAKKLGTSAAYITKVFRGDTNFTIETMVKLARAAGAALDVKLVEPATLSVSSHTQSTAIFISRMSKTQLTASSARDSSVELVPGERFGEWSTRKYIDVTAFQSGALNA
jgi:transcriptional regulator with XRE-family HTH domain